MAALKMPDKIKGPLFLDAESTLRVPARPCLPRTLLGGAWTVLVFPFATPGAANNNNNNNNNKTPATNTHERVGHAY